MTVKELIEELESFDGDMEVVMKPSNSIYVDGVCEASKYKLRAFYGEDRNVLVLMSSGQEGAL